MLIDLRCPGCEHQFEYSGRFPVLLSRDAKFHVYRQIAETYDAIYLQDSNIWESQGRTPEFVQYFSGLLGEFPAKRFLEIGCGEGRLLAAVSANEKFGTDLSIQALEETDARTAAELCVALGERLPFGDGSFDLATSVGVMEHFLDAEAASREVLRVLRNGGRYVALIHVHMTFWQSFRQKIAEYVYPRPRPIRLVTWLRRKLIRPVHQPIQNRFTLTQAKLCLEQSGFVVLKVIHKSNDPAAPLIGPHVVIYICQKPLSVT